MRAVLALAALLLSPLPALADTAADVRAAYLAFAAAQNARDPERIRSLLAPDPDLLWVSDGKSFWGADAILARMSSFQRAATWRVEPDLAASRVIAVGDGVALLHLPLRLVIGPAENPDRLDFLVSILFREIGADWRIAALMTTTQKP